ncbi:MAG: HlyC/CorC family transporter [Chlamydiales bacterium]|nr:HlyC/CorC family transporter [Chlamydiales bacterium]
MLTLCILLALFFLIWVFFLTTMTHSLTRLGETASLEIIKTYPKRFFYYPFHRAIFKDPAFELVIFSATLGENLARLGFAATAVYGTLFVLSLQVWHAAALLLILLLLMLLIGDFFPRLWAIRASEYALSFCAAFASFFLFLSLPLSFLFLKLSDYVTRVHEKERGGDKVEEMKEAVVQILRAAGVKGRLNTSDKKLIESVIKFKDRIVREVMVPRVDLFSLTAETPIREAAKSLVEEGYSRTPVYRDTVDNIIGVLMFKDILELYMACLEGKKEASLLDAPIDSIAKSVFYTPETKRVSQLLQEFRTKQMHMAIVVDEYGGTEGVVTIEDILEEIVGEIADEYDIDEELLYTAQPGGGSWIVDARMSILDAEETFNIHIPQEGEYDTIGGYIFHKVGSIPHKGLRIHHEDFDLEILSSSERSVDKVRITSRQKVNEQ